MIDAATGAVAFEGSASLVSPATGHGAFVLSDDGRSAEPFVADAPWCSCKLSRRCSGTAFVVVLWFHGERLCKVTLANADPAFGTSWETWSMAKETARKAAHDAWLAAVLPSEQRTFPWGEVRSFYDERAEGSVIEISYSPADGGPQSR